MEELEIGKTYYREVTVNGEPVNKWVVLTSIERFDADGTLIYKAWYDGKEAWYENDSHGKRILEKRDNGQEFTWKRKYDENGNLIWFKRSGTDGIEKWFEYNSQGKVIHTKNSNDEECFWEYDSKGNMIYANVFGKPEIWIEYDSNGKPIHIKDSNDYEEWYEWEGEKSKFNKRTKNSYGEEQFMEMNEKGDILHFVNSNGAELWNEFEYNENGKRKTVYSFKSK